MTGDLQQKQHVYILLCLPCRDRQLMRSSVVTCCLCGFFVCPAGGGPSEGAEAAHQTAEGGTEETSTEGRSQFGDQIQERERK